MIKVIVRRNAPKGKHYRITCTHCKSIFECEPTDCYKIPISHGTVVSAIHCPVCKRTCYDWQDGCDEWKEFYAEEGD